MSEKSLYIHIPFCRYRCGYCDFNTYAGLDELKSDYVTAICCELELLAATSPQRLSLHTIFFGGGTPSLLEVSQVALILDTMHRYFNLSPGVEISFEANPGTLSQAYLDDLYGLGINRLSMGMQSADLSLLRLLDRQHKPWEVFDSVRFARKAGFENVNLDLIFGIPGQSLGSWQQTLNVAIALEPEHLSLYSLTVEKDTPFNAWVNHGLVSEPDPDQAADMYGYAVEKLEALNFEHYEISNWAAKNGVRSLSCRHNLQYWRALPYIGIGAGAHGYIQNFRTINVAHPRLYIEKVMQGGQQEFPRSPATVSLNPIDKETEIGETMMMGLRLLLEGVSARTFSQRFDENLREYFKAEINKYTSLGLLEWGGAEGDSLRLSRKGYLLGNQVFQAFI
jgi:oxygen-independent coproporphyrinogen-3 oxidase